jgi:hypothetical protein
MRSSPLRSVHADGVASHASHLASPAWRRLALVAAGAALAVLHAARLAGQTPSDSIRADSIPADSIRADSVRAGSARMHVVKLRDGSSIIGRVVDVGSDSIQVTTSAGRLTLVRSAVVSMEEVRPGAMRNGEYWFPNPNPTRLLFAPTGRMLKQGEGYFSDYYLFFVGGAAGLTNHVSIGGGMSVFPTTNFADNAFYFTPKVGLYDDGKLSVAAGALMAVAGAASGEGASFGILYGVGTYGSPESSVTAGLGYGYSDGRLTDRPTLMFGGEARASRRTALVSENYVFPSSGASSILSGGIRFFGEKLTVDLAILGYFGQGEHFGPVPYVDFVVNF